MAPRVVFEAPRKIGIKQIERPKQRKEKKKSIRTLYMRPLTVKMEDLKVYTGFVYIEGHAVNVNWV